MEKKGKNMESNLIKIDKEFQNLIPGISYEEFCGLEESIKKEGCRDPIITWNNTILDGYNRHKICKAYGIKFETKEIQCESREEAKIWIIKNQFARRNLSPYQRGVLALKLEEIESKKAKERMSLGGKGVVILPQVKGKTREIIAREAGIKSGRTIDKIKEIEKKATPKQKEKLIKGERTISSVYMDIKQREIKEGVSEIPLPKEKFSIIYADPPWEYKWSTRGAAAHHYNTENLDKLKKIKVPAEKNAVMFMWATNPKLNEALELLKAWGFEYKTNMVWVKDKFGTGWWVRGQHEILLLGTKGKVKTPSHHLRPSSVINAARVGHSKKPGEIYRIIEKMFPDMKYLEMFARSERENWISWGLECGYKNSSSEQQ
jgi:N6-adenosine-specific RNA methylase IME4